MHGKSLGPLVARTPRRRRDAFYVARQRHVASQRRPAALQSGPNAGIQRTFARRSNRALLTR
jgi:hypothetical protein